MNVMALSPTKIQTLDCPRRFRALYIDQVDEGTAPELALGSLVHEVAASYVRLLRDQRRASSEYDLGEIVKAAWTGRDPDVSAEMYPDFIRFCRELLNWIPDPDTIVDAEQDLAVTEDWKPIGFSDIGAAFRGILDVIQIVKGEHGARILVRDWTTGALGGSIEGKKDLQLRHYGLLAACTYGVGEVEVTMHSLRTGASVTVELKEGDHEETRARLLAERTRLGGMLEDASFAWDPAPGTACGICRLSCPAAGQALAAGAPLRAESPGHARDLLAQVVILDEFRKRLMKPLRGFASQHGAIENNGMVYEARPTVSRTYPMGETAVVLEAAGIPSGAVLKVDGKLLKKAIGKNRELAEAVAALEIRKTSERFSVHKAGPPDEDEEGDSE